MSSVLQSVLTRMLAFAARDRQRIFISYRRRGEGAGYAGRLADRLIHEFGSDQCFRDIDDIESGTDFVEAISHAVGSCDVLIAVIGPDWLSATDAHGQRRLENERDFVRLEITAALARDIRVVPVLVGAALMPTPEQLPDAMAALSRRQAHELSDTRWDYDVSQLITSIERLGIRRARDASRQPVRRRWKLAGALVAGFTAISLGIAALSSAIDRMNTASLDTLPAFTPAAGGSAVDGIRTASESVPLRTPHTELVKSGADRRDVSYQPPDPTLGQGPAILAAMRRANQAETEAFRALDEDVLNGPFTGEALAMEQLALRGLAAAGQFTVNTLHDQRILSLNVSPDGSSATVRAVETWSDVHYNALLRQCMFRVPPHEVPQTVRLLRVAGLWRVTAIEGDAAESPDPTPCV